MYKVFEKCSADTEQLRNVIAASVASKYYTYFIKIESLSKFSSFYSTEHFEAVNHLRNDNLQQSSTTLFKETLSILPS